jgi:large subunit ribosomal protein L5
MADLHKKYKEELISQLQKELGVTNVMAIPRLTKIVVNMGVKDATADKKLIDRMGQIVSQITGQKARVARAKKSIATFKLREGDPIGLTVTMRGKRMYSFMDKLISVVLPRIKDFRGVKATSFDGRGNYALGFNEYAVFPEIDLGSVERVQGLEVIIVMSAKTDAEGLALLKAFGMPFQKTKS